MKGHSGPVRGTVGPRILGLSQEDTTVWSVVSPIGLQLGRREVKTVLESTVGDTADLYFQDKETGTGTSGAVWCFPLRIPRFVELAKPSHPITCSIQPLQGTDSELGSFGPLSLVLAFPEVSKPLYLYVSGAWSITKGVLAWTLGPCK